MKQCEAVILLVLAVIAFSPASGFSFPTANSGNAQANRNDYPGLLEAFNKAHGKSVDTFGLYTQSARLFAADGTESDLFGAAVAISGDTAVVSTDFDYTPGTGEVFVFVRSGNEW